MSFSTNKRKKNPHHKRKRFSFAQKTIMAVIIVAFLAVIITTVTTIVSKPESRVKREISNLASSYYEDFLYQAITNSKKSHDFSETMEEYEALGFPTIYLRQLLYHDKNLDQETIDYVKKYCDENKTSVKIYPYSPYNKNSYRVNYSYSCEF